MKAQDFMTRDVVAVHPDTPVYGVAARMAEKRISGVPVVDEAGKLIGIVSESDLMRRSELGTEVKRKWWLSLFTDPDQIARDYTQSHALKVADVMSPSVVSVTEDTTLKDVAATFDGKRIKRLPVVRDGKLVGMLTRSDLVRALASFQPIDSAAALDDASIYADLTRRMAQQAWVDPLYLNITVTKGVVELRGFIPTEEQRRALRIVVERTPGVRGVDDRLVIGLPASTEL